MRQGGCLAVKAATTAAVATAAKATTIAAAETAAAVAIASAEATTTCAAWALHHQIHAGACGVRLAATAAAWGARHGGACLGAQMRIGTWWLIFKAAVAVVAIWLALLASGALLTGWTRLAGGAGLACAHAFVRAWAGIVTRRALAGAVIALAAAAVLAFLTFRGRALCTLGGWRVHADVSHVQRCSGRMIAGQHVLAWRTARGAARSLAFELGAGCCIATWCARRASTALGLR